MTGRRKRGRGRIKGKKSKRKVDRSVYYEIFFFFFKQKTAYEMPK